MPATFHLSIKDETSSGKLIQEIFISLTSGRMTIKELIERRIQQEVANYNSQMP